MNKIIKFTKEKPEKLPRISEADCSLQYGKPPCECKHPKLELDIDTRTVHCLQCGKYVDPFDALLQYANEERYFLSKGKGYQAALRAYKTILKKREKGRINDAEYREIETAHVKAFVNSQHEQNKERKWKKKL